jgi:hypothetical protein
VPVIVVRYTNYARYGMGDALVQLTREMLGVLARDPRVSGVRVLTDLSGPTFTVESEWHVASLAVFEQVQAELLRGSAFASWFARVQPLVDHGRRDFYTVQG